MSIADVVGGSGVGEIRVDVQIDLRIGEVDVCPDNLVFKGFSLVVPLSAAICNAPLHRQNSIILVHQSTTALGFLVQMDDFHSNSRVIQVDQSSVDLASYLWLFQVCKLGIVRYGWS
jgi:hypothetical protein